MDLASQTAIVRATRVYQQAGDPRPRPVIDLTGDQTLDADAVSVALLPELLQFHLNGAADVASQTARVHWLDDAARLVIPAALRQPDAADGEAPARYASVQYLVDRIATRLHDGDFAQRVDAAANFDRARRANVTFVDEDRVIVNLEPDGTVVAAPTATSQEGHDTEITIAFDRSGGGFADPAAADLIAANVPPGNDRNAQLQALDRVPERLHAFQFLESEPLDVVCARLALRFRLNIDPRDIGAFDEPGMRFPDGECQAELPLERFRCRLRAFTVASIAALNLAAMGMHAILAVARAHGVAAGMVPTADTLHGEEITFVHHRARAVDVVQCARAIGDDADAAFRASMSIHAVFGGLHLAANHTYRAADNALRRRGDAWLAGLRTVTAQAVLAGIQMAPELVLRTCSHPFGLASTYAALKWGAEHNRIAEPIAVRVNVIPPSTQRLAMLHATLVKIGQLPIGRDITRAYQEDVNRMRRGLTAVLAAPTRYSPLSRMYGTPVTLTLDEETVAAMGRVAPMCAGFAQAFFSGQQGGGRARGVGLALSLANILRDDEAMVNVWSNAFLKYTEDVGDEGIMSLLPQQGNAANAARPAGRE